MAAWKNKKTKRWAAKFQYRNRQHKKEGFLTKSEALRWEVEKRQRLKNPPQPEATAITFSQVSTKYLEDCEARFRLNTWRQKAFVYRNFLSFINDDPPIDSIPKENFIEFLKHRKNRDGNCAANRDLKEFKALYKWGIWQELLAINPCEHIKKFPEEKKDRYVPPEEDIKKVLLAADREDMDLILTIYHTAGRISEILNMTWEDVDFKNDGWVKLWTRKRRGGEPEVDKLPMTDTLYSVLKARWGRRNSSTPYVFHKANGQPYTYYQKRDMMNKLCRKAGVKVFGFHALRHHVASILADSGKAGLPGIQKLLRHKKASTTDNYIKTLDPQLRQVANILEELLNGRKK